MHSTSSDVIEPTDWHDTRRSSTIDRNRNRDSYRDSYRESDFTHSKNSSFIGNGSVHTGQAYDETDGFFNLLNNSSNKVSSPPSRQAKSKKGSKKMKLSQKLSDIVIYTQAWFQNRFLFSHWLRRYSAIERASF